MPHFEETEKPRYPKDLDVGRIVIEEIAEEKKEVTKRDDFKRDEVKPRYEKHTKKLYRDEKDGKLQLREDVIGVGRLDITEYEKTQREPERVGERTTLQREDKVKLL